MRHLARLLALVRAVTTLVRLRSRVLYLPLDGGLGLIYGAVMCVFARLIGARIYLHHHSFAYIDARSAAFELVLVSAGPSATHVVLCPAMGERLRSRYPRLQNGQDRQRVVGNGFMIDTPATPPRGKSERPLVIGHLSNLTREKGVLEVIDLFEQLRREGVEVHARIAGPCADKAILTRLSEANAVHGQALEWIGPCYGEAKAEFLAGCDLFVFPTTYANEAQPLVLLEALAAGLPILSIDRGCIGCDFDADFAMIAADLEEFRMRAPDWVVGLSNAPARLEALSGQAEAVAAKNKETAEAALIALINEMATAG